MLHTRFLTEGLSKILLWAAFEFRFADHTTESILILLKDNPKFCFLIHLFSTDRVVHVLPT